MTTDIGIRTQQVKVPNGDLQIEAYLAQPGHGGTFPPVIVIQEIFGVNIHIREVAEKLAKEGYVAIAPTLYYARFSALLLKSRLRLQAKFFCPGKSPEISRF